MPKFKLEVRLRPKKAHPGRFALLFTFLVLRAISKDTTRYVTACN
jgi:hypothetical protein